MMEEESDGEQVRGEDGSEDEEERRGNARGMLLKHDQSLALMERLCQRLDYLEREVCMLRGKEMGSKEDKRLSLSLGEDSVFGGSDLQSSSVRRKHPGWPLLRSMDTIELPDSARESPTSTSSGSIVIDNSHSSSSTSPSSSSTLKPGEGNDSDEPQNVVEVVTEEGEGDGGEGTKIDEPLAQADSKKVVPTEPITSSSSTSSSTAGAAAASPRAANTADIGVMTTPKHSTSSLTTLEQQALDKQQQQQQANATNLSNNNSNNHSNNSNRSIEKPTSELRRRRKSSWGGEDDGEVRNLASPRNIPGLTNTSSYRNHQHHHQAGGGGGVDAGNSGTTSSTSSNKGLVTGAGIAGGDSSRIRSRKVLSSLGNYVWHEVFGAQEYYEKEEVTSKADTVVHNFLHVPVKLEECLSFGLAICIDSFLYAITVLPLRVLVSAFLAFTSYVYPRRKRRFHRNNAYDLMRGMTLLISCLVLQTFQISRVYHYIRGQATIKLYVLTAMFEILDKLMVSFGQDTLDSLYWSARKNTKKRHLSTNFLVATGYVLIHAILLFIHIVTLFVAVNSADQALLTLLISNNFAEMKTSVFKRFDPKLLFQLTCSDMVERFKLLLFLLLITILNMGQAADTDSITVVLDMGRVLLLIFVGEMVADSVKHAFITKFNEIDASCYEKSSEELAKEVTFHRRRSNLMLDHTHVISKKIGLAQLPLAAVAIRFSAIAWSFTSSLSYLGLISFFLMLFLALVMLKIVSGIIVTQWAGSIEGKERGKREMRESMRQQTAAANANAAALAATANGGSGGGGGGGPAGALQRTYTPRV